MVGAEGFVEVLVDTRLAVCESRDPKGIYARARQGLLHNVTGIDDPYERPETADLTLQTTGASASANASAIEALLLESGFLRE